MIPDAKEIQAARAALAVLLPRTRLVRSESLSRRSGANVFLKLENELPTGSFKPRGALYALQKNAAARTLAGVVASSTGNHGAAVAFAASRLNIPATIFLPENPNPVKRARIAELGATIFEHGPDLAAAATRARAFAAERGFFFLNDANDPDVPAGAGTIALEILDELPGADALVVPMGDTALIRGVAAAAKHRNPRILILGVQAERAPSYYLSWKSGSAVQTERCDTLADGLATRTPIESNVQAIRALVDGVLLVSEEDLLRAVARLHREEKITAEPAGAAATAAFLAAAGEFAGKSVALLVTGGNIPADQLQRALAQVPA